MAVNDVQEARRHWSRLLAGVEAGQEVVIARGGAPVARLVPYRPASQRQPDTLKGTIVIPDGFFDPLPEQEIEAWEGRRPGARPVCHPRLPVVVPWHRGWAERGSRLVLSGRFSGPAGPRRVTGPRARRESSFRQRADESSVRPGYPDKGRDRPLAPATPAPRLVWKGCPNSACSGAFGHVSHSRRYRSVARPCCLESPGVHHGAKAGCPVRRPTGYRLLPLGRPDGHQSERAR